MHAEVMLSCMLLDQSSSELVSRYHIPAFLPCTGSRPCLLGGVYYLKMHHLSAFMPDAIALSVVLAGQTTLCICMT